MRPNPCLRQLVSTDTTAWPYLAEDSILNRLTLCSESFNVVFQQGYRPLELFTPTN
jgi:hypothetical protein